jgi:hypothetical protein
MIASVLIMLFSVALLVYWFRYSCILLLRSQIEAAEGITDLQEDRFGIGELRARLDTEPELDPLHASLQRDYEVLTYLFQHAAGLELRSFEDRILVIDYRLMQWRYRLTKSLAPDQAREALKEMATVMGILAGKLGQRAASHTAE